MAGDASMHLGWTFHTAAGNSAATPRCALAISFFVDGADRVLVCKAKHSCGQIK
jgi:ectoine hydroxylase-related dioxygenase (phytanoyl-CoA dioxygenase family)